MNPIAALCVAAAFVFVAWALDSSLPLGLAAMCGAWALISVESEGSSP